VETKATTGVFKHAAFASRAAHRSLLFGSCLDLLIKFTNEMYHAHPATSWAMELFKKEFKCSHPAGPKLVFKLLREKMKTP